ncbi:insulinase family protein, partial [Candidatus Dojkabacteria bacterium]|nr:insulinase family protein [Candidatus Dojkabacteria bacterium]
QQSILWKRLREELGIVYGVSAYGWDYFNRAFTIIETSFQPQYLEQVLQEIYDGINQIKSAKVADTVFKTRQKRIVDTELMIYDSPSNVLNWIMDQENEYEYHKEFLTPTDFIELVKKLDFSEVVEMANEVYDWDKVNIGIVSKDDPSEVQKKLESIWQKITKNGKKLIR